MGRFSLLIFVLFCACVTAEWVDLDNNGKIRASVELEGLLEELDRTQNHHVTVDAIKWAQVNDGGNTKIYTIRFAGTTLRDSYDCHARIEQTGRKQVLHLECENLSYTVERMK